MRKFVLRKSKGPRKAAPPKSSGKKHKIKPKNTQERRKRRLLFLLLAAGLALLVFIFLLLFHVRRVEVVGNDHYTDEEITEMVTDGFFEKNAAVLWLMNRGRKIEGNSFIDTITVELSSPWAIRIRVAEKKLAGYIRAEDAYWYFDAGGIARVCSEEGELMCLSRVRGRIIEEKFSVTEEGFLDIGDAILRPLHFNDGGNYIPFVRGARAEKPALGQPLNESQTASFRIVAAAKSYIDKCSFRPDSVEITPEGRIWLRIGDVVVDLGSDGRVEIKLRELEGIYPKLSGRRGTLHLENYDGTRNRIIFSGEAEEELPTESGGEFSQEK
ncbi:MAG: cell division protein FtsQ/DivIB [Lachnospiraceae bacterium]